MLFESLTNNIDQINQKLYERFGIIEIPFPSASQTSEHPHAKLFPSEEDKIEREIEEFYRIKNSGVIVITATQGIGKTNLLNYYEMTLKKLLTRDRGFFVIRYVADPDPTLERIIISIIENLGITHLMGLTDILSQMDTSKRAKCLEVIRTSDFRIAFDTIIKCVDNDKSAIDEKLKLFYQWLMGSPVRKAHNDELNIYYRLETIESKNRALRDLVYLSAKLGKLSGIFLLLDELEKQDFNLTKTHIIRFLVSLRALIDSFPKYLFLMLATTNDSLIRYGEMVPAIKGRLKNIIDLPPLRDSNDALALYTFYHEKSRKKADAYAKKHSLQIRRSITDRIVNSDEAIKSFEQLLSISTIKGVRQRDYLNSLYQIAMKNQDYQDIIHNQND